MLAVCVAGRSCVWMVEGMVRREGIWLVLPTLIYASSCYVRFCTWWYEGGDYALSCQYSQVAATIFNIAVFQVAGLLTLGVHAQ